MQATIQAKNLNPSLPTRPALLLNPYAWSNQQNPKQCFTLLKTFSSLGRVFVSYDQISLRKELVSWKNAGVDFIAISGGDGTIHAAIAEIVKVWGEQTLPKFLFLHGGTVGIVSKVAGHRKPLDSIDMLRKKLYSQKPLPEKCLNTLQVGKRLTFTLGFGVFSRVCREVYQQGIRGPHKIVQFATKLVASSFVKGSLYQKLFRSWEGTLQIDNNLHINKHFLGFYASVLDRFWGISDLSLPYSEDGFRVFVVNEVPKKPVSHLLSYFLRQNQEIPGTHSYLARSVKLESQTPFFLMADGEFWLQNTPVTMKIGPQLQVIQFSSYM